MLSTEIATTDSKQKHTNTLLCFKKSIVKNLRDYKKESKQNIKMMIHRNDKTTLLIHNKQQRQQQMKWLHSSLLITLLAIFSITKLVVCQDFEDLNSNSNKQSPTFNNGQPAHHSFQPLNRLNPAQQQQQHVATVQQQSSTSSSRFTMQRPILSSRFAPNYSPSGGGGGQQLAAQASSSSSIFSGPPSSLSASLQQPQQQVSGSGGSSSSSSNSGASVSNIEQLMKNALARTAQLNSAVSAAEPRQDTAAPSQPEAPILAPSRSSVLQQQQQQQQPQQQQQASSTREAALSKQQESSKNAEPSAETSPSEIQSANAQSEDPEKSTTTAQATTANSHETVYSDQRFANLFARRGNNKKSRITPSEQIKAKPTLPSFIKSLPDPKQFNAAQTTNQDNTSTNINNNRPVASSSTNSFASQRLQAQNQIRLNQINNQQKKPVITSNSAAIANNKRNNLQNGNKLSSVAATNANPRLASNLNKASTSKPNVPIPSNNNPFNKSQNLSSDPANVIAMARKRLLANNALESAKLKQQQQKQPN